MKKRLRQSRKFSEGIKKKIVSDIECGKCSVKEASREIDVAERTVYTWLNKYSRFLKSNSVLVVEEKSEIYRSRELEKRIKDLEAALGRKQMEIELLEKILDLAGESYGEDLKKSFSNQPWNGSGSAKESITDTK